MGQSWKGICGVKDSVVAMVFNKFRPNGAVFYPPVTGA